MATRNTARVIAAGTLLAMSVPALAHHDSWQRRGHAPARQVVVERPVYVDRPVYVALTLPPGSGPTPIQEISRLIATTLPARAVDPAPVG